MNAVDLLDGLVERDVRLTVRGGPPCEVLHVDAPAGAVDGPLRRQLAHRKSELIALLRDGRTEPVVVDFETRSLAPLREVGGRKYANHPSTEAICMVARMPDGDVIVWNTGEPPPPALMTAVAGGTPLVAHNANTFDRFIWEALGWPPAIWIDTIQLASLVGLPRGLEQIAHELLGQSKDLRGRAAALRLSRKDTTGNLPAIHADQLRDVIAYCRTDVELLAEMWQRGLGAARHVEVDLRDLDREINDRGFCFDADLAAAIIECDELAAAEVKVEAGVDSALLQSPAKLLAELQRHGVEATDVRKATLQALLDTELPVPARRVVEARLASASITASKLNAALASVGDDGRLRDTLVYHGSHTGRWTGRGFQPQNLPRGESKVDVDAAIAAVVGRDHGRVRELAGAAGVTVRDVAATLIRACVRAGPGHVLAVADYAAVEPRALSWFVDDKEGLQLFRDGGDIYKPMAARLFGVDAERVTKEQRNAGKPPVLGCGYGMGADRFGGYAEEFGIDWTRMPVTPHDVVEMWRDANPLVAGARTGGRGRRRGGLWQALEDASVRAALGEEVEVHSTSWSRDRADVICTLPSGRRMVYGGALVETVRTPWGALREAMTYRHYDGGKSLRAKTYGGLLTENIIQGICRDVLADALLRLERAGFRIVLHVHDEVIAELVDPTRFDELVAIMSQPPTWAPGLPLVAEGYVSTRYRGK